MSEKNNGVAPWLWTLLWVLTFGIFFAVWIGSCVFSGEDSSKRTPETAQREHISDFERSIGYKGVPEYIVCIGDVDRKRGRKEIYVAYPPTENLKTLAMEFITNAGPGSLEGTSQNGLDYSGEYWDPIRRAYNRAGYFELKRVERELAGFRTGIRGRLDNLYIQDLIRPVIIFTGRKFPNKGDPSSLDSREMHIIKNTKGKRGKGY